MKNYPVLNLKLNQNTGGLSGAYEALGQIQTVINQIVRTRNSEDVGDFNNIVSTYVSGRTTTRVPTSSTNVLTTDSVGDQLFANGFFYKLVNNNGTIQWLRVAMGSF